MKRSPNFVTQRLTRERSQAGQRGFALMLLLLLVAVVLTTFLIGYASPRAQTINADKATAAALAQARDALIGRSLNDDNRPGSLPCPDTDNDGVADLFIGNECPSYIGRLPWKTLGLMDIRDGSGERLWYALSRSLRDHASAQPINSETPGQLTVIGTSPAVNVAAVVFSPGQTLNGQIRDIANENNVTNYLEGENADGNTPYASGLLTDTFNDRVLVLTNDVLFRAVEYRVAGEIRTSLRTYYLANGYYPFASNYADPNFDCAMGVTRGRLPGVVAGHGIAVGCAGPPPVADWGAAQPAAWFVANNWHLLIYYTVAPACTRSNPNCSGSGYITVNNTPFPNNNKQALLIAAGRAVGVQVRPSTNVTNYLDHPENTDLLNDVYIRLPQSPDFNDKLVVVGP